MQRGKKLGLIALTLLCGGSILSVLLRLILNARILAYLLSGSTLVLGIVLAILALKGEKEH